MDSNTSSFFLQNSRLSSSSSSFKEGTVGVRVNGVSEAVPKRIQIRFMVRVFGLFIVIIKMDLIFIMIFG